MAATDRQAPVASACVLGCCGDGKFERLCMAAGCDIDDGAEGPRVWWPRMASRASVDV